jgi:hypothetical protein
MVWSSNRKATRLRLSGRTGTIRRLQENTEVGEMMTKDDVNNPFVAYLNRIAVTPTEFAIMARVDYVDVYSVRKARSRVLPKSFVRAIDERSGAGAGEKIAAAYLAYRETLREALMGKK